VFAGDLSYEPNCEAAKKNARIAYTRMLLQRADHERAAFSEIAALLAPGARAELAGLETLLLALRHEAFDLLKTRKVLPTRQVLEIGKIAGELALGTIDLDVRLAAVEVRWVTDRETFRDFFIQYILANLANGQNIALLLTEVLVQIAITSESAVADVACILEGSSEAIDPPRQREFAVADVARILEEASDAIESSRQREFVSTEVRPMLASMRRGLDYEKRLEEANKSGFANNVARISSILTDHSGGAHRFLQKAFTYIDMISNCSGARSVLNDYYYGPDSFASLAIDQLLPCVAAAESAFESLEDVEDRYLLHQSTPSLRSDLYRLDSVMNLINGGLASGKIDDKAIHELYDDPEFGAARRRLMNWLAKGDTPRLKRTIDGFVCDVGSIIRGSCDRWQPESKRKNITFGTNFLEQPVLCFGPGIKGVRSVVDDLLNNAVDHAFEHHRPEQPAVTVDLRIQKPFAELCVADNGSGLRPGSDGGLGRINAVVRPFGGQAELRPVAAGTTVSVRLLMKEV